MWADLDDPGLGQNHQFLLAQAQLAAQDLLIVLADEGAVREMVLTLCGKGPQFVQAYRFPAAHRTSNALDRLMHHQDRRLSAMRSLHGTPASARLAVRAMALPWNFHPYGARCRGDDRTRRSPFHDLNGFEYHPNWLHTLLIASSMGGRRR